MPASSRRAGERVRGRARRAWRPDSRGRARSPRRRGVAQRSACAADRAACQSAQVADCERGGAGSEARVASVAERARVGRAPVGREDRARARTAAARSASRRAGARRWRGPSPALPRPGLSAAGAACGGVTAAWRRPCSSACRRRGRRPARRARGSLRMRSWTATVARRWPRGGLRPGLRGLGVPVAARVADRGRGAVHEHRLLDRDRRCRCRPVAAALRQEARARPCSAPASARGSPVQLAFVPSGPTLLNQQLPVSVGNSSHQKSTPFGFCLPLGARPDRRCRSSGCRTRSRSAFAIVQVWVPGGQLIASGTASSIVRGASCSRCGCRGRCRRCRRRSGSRCRAAPRRRRLDVRIARVVVVVEVVRVDVVLLEHRAALREAGVAAGVERVGGDRRRCCRRSCCARRGSRCPSSPSSRGCCGGGRSG